MLSYNALIHLIFSPQNLHRRFKPASHLFNFRQARQPDHQLPDSVLRHHTGHARECHDHPQVGLLPNKCALDDLVYEAIIAQRLIAIYQDPNLGFVSSLLHASTLVVMLSA